MLEGNAVYLNQSPKGERQLAMLWVLSLSDGDHSLLDVAERAGLPFGAVRQAADALLEHELLV